MSLNFSSPPRSAADGGGGSSSVGGDGVGEVCSPSSPDPVGRATKSTITTKTIHSSDNNNSRRNGSRRKMSSNQFPSPSQQQHQRPFSPMSIKSSSSRNNQQEQSPLRNPTLIGQLHNQFSADNEEDDERFRRERQRKHPYRGHDQQQQQHPTTPGRTGGTHHLAYQHYYVLPVLLLEFLAIALTRAVLPGMLLKEYGSNVYLVLGAADCVRGLLAFFACPLFGKLSDVLFGRRLCLFITVLGSCAPVCSLAFFSGWDGDNKQSGGLNSSGGEEPSLVEMIMGTTSSTMPPSSTDDFASTGDLSSVVDVDPSSSSSSESPFPPMAIPLFVILLSLSGIFSSTFTLVFAYISDSVRERNERVSAYGLALATFGLSFTIGPMAGGYLANYNTDYVFRSSLVLTIVDLFYIYWFLPESKPPPGGASTFFGPLKGPAMMSGGLVPSSGASTASNSSSVSFFAQIADSISWSPWESLHLVLQDPFLRKVGEIAFFYYTGLWAVISTLSLYAVQHFHMTPERLGELMSVLGLSTMVAEAVLVRLMVPLVGEKRSIRIGLASFALQCLVLGLANTTWELFICVGFSILGNLVYPSLSSLVSGTVQPEKVGEALGAINGIKALTEGLGPLVFGALMTVSEHTAYPGSPYWLASVLVLIAYRLAGQLPDNSGSGDAAIDTSPNQMYSSYSSPDKYPPHPLSPPGYNRIHADEEYVHELEFKKRIPKGMGSSYGVGGGSGDVNSQSSARIGNQGCLSTMFPSLTQTPIRDDHDEEYQALLSEIEESDPDNEEDDNDNDGTASNYVSAAEDFDSDDNDDDGGPRDVSTDLSFARQKL
mmetsp:Transcript_20909/g.49651  ORF Transcript_20909/g.49651 Transcript_20909/m.49651 type:complete len:826 (+) Transcript_20909:104-2581(+)